MKKIFLLIVLSLSMVSCAKVSEQEIIEMKKICNYSNQDIGISSYGDSVFCRYRPDNVSWCISKYVDAIDEKYNNPDTVSNLSEESYATVVRACQDTFGKTLSGNINQ